MAKTKWVVVAENDGMFIAIPDDDPNKSMMWNGQRWFGPKPIMSWIAHSEGGWKEVSGPPSKHGLKEPTDVRVK